MQLPGGARGGPTPRPPAPAGAPAAASPEPDGAGGGFLLSRMGFLLTTSRRRRAAGPACPAARNSTHQLPRPPLEGGGCLDSFGAVDSHLSNNNKAIRQSERGESLAPNESNVFHILQNSGFRHFCYLIAPSLVWTLRPAFCPRVPSLLFAWTFRALSLSLCSFPAFCLDLSVASPSFPSLHAFFEFQFNFCPLPSGGGAAPQQTWGKRGGR